MLSNLPPGVNPSDIPGNRPEDTYWEMVLDDFYASLTDNKEWGRLEDANIPDIIVKALQWGTTLGRDEIRKEQAECHHHLSNDIWDALDTFQNKLERYLERRPDETKNLSHKVTNPSFSTSSHLL